MIRTIFSVRYTLHSVALKLYMYYILIGIYRHVYQSFYMFLFLSVCVRSHLHF